ncbi:MAG: formylglycine-generating enzyme family protein [Promethearchaeota archaeon]
MPATEQRSTFKRGIRDVKDIQNLNRSGYSFQEQWNSILRSEILKNGGMSFYDLLQYAGFTNQAVDDVTKFDYIGVAADFSSKFWLSLEPDVQGKYASDFQKWYKERCGLKHPEIKYKGKKLPIEMELIPPGVYWQGSPEDEPDRDEDENRRMVLISKSFWCDKYAVTQELWKLVEGTDPSHFKGARRPVERVSWNDCEAFNKKIDVNFLTEAQWEYACRAGTTSPFSFGHNITTDQVNYDGNYPYNGGEKGIYRAETVEVGSLPGNPWGLYEMHGNVWEWCQDWYSDRYETES